MFEPDPREAKELTQHTGLKIGVILLPMLLLFAYFGKEDMGLAVAIVLAAIMVAIKIRWNLRKHIWFWAIIAVILALHVPLILKVRWPQGSAPTLFYTMPFGLADFLIISGFLRQQKNFSRKFLLPKESVWHYIVIFAH